MRILIAATLILASAAALAQPKPTVSLDLSSATVTKGGELKGTITVKVPSGHHLYQNPPTKDYQIPVKITSADSAVKLVKAAYPKGDDYTDSTGASYRVYKGTVKIPVTLKMPDAVGKKTIKLKFAYQMCNDTSCYAPASLIASNSVTLKARSSYAAGFFSSLLARVSTPFS